jgi:hypothetical protein
MFTEYVDEPRLTAEYPVLADAPVPLLRDIGDALSKHLSAGLGALCPERDAPVRNAHQRELRQRRPGHRRRLTAIRGNGELRATPECCAASRRFPDVSDMDTALFGRDGLSLSITPAYVDGAELADGSGKAGEVVRAYGLRIQRAGRAKVEYWPERTQAWARADRLLLAHALP